MEPYTIDIRFEVVAVDYLDSSKRVDFDAWMFDSG